MLIKFEVKYEYCSESECRAIVTAWLPKDKGGFVEEVFRGNLCGFPILAHHGEDDGAFRRINFYFTAESLEDLDSMIEQSIMEYRNQVSVSVKTALTKKVLFVDFPDPV